MAESRSTPTSPEASPLKPPAASPSSDVRVPTTPPLPTSSAAIEPIDSGSRINVDLFNQSHGTLPTRTPDAPIRRLTPTLFTPPLKAAAPVAQPKIPVDPVEKPKIPIRRVKGKSPEIFKGKMRELEEVGAARPQDPEIDLEAGQIDLFQPLVIRGVELREMPEPVRYIELRTLPTDENPEAGVQQLTVKVPRSTFFSWTFEEKDVPNKYILFPGTNTYKVNPVYEQFVKMLKNILDTNSDHWKSWDFWIKVVAAAVPIILAGLEGASQIYYKRTGTSKEDNTVWNTTMSSIVLFIGVASTLFALFAMYSRGTNQEMMNIGTDSLETMGEDASAQFKTYMHR